MNNIIKSPIASLKVYDTKLPKEEINTVTGRPFCSLSYRKEGVVKFNIGKDSFISRPDSISFMPKGQSYNTEIIEDTRMVVIHFNVFDENIAATPFVIENKISHIQQLFNLVLKNYSAEDVNNYECYSYFYKILAEIEKYFQKNNADKINPAVAAAKLKIEKNFADSNFNIDSLISCLDISASHLRSEFKKTIHSHL